MTFEASLALVLVLGILVFFIWAIGKIITQIWESQLDTSFKVFWIGFILFCPTIGVLVWFAFCHLSHKIRKP